MPNQPTGPHNGQAKKFWTQHSISPADNSRVGAPITKAQQFAQQDSIAKAEASKADAVSDNPNMADVQLQSMQNSSAASAKAAALKPQVGADAAASASNKKKYLPELK